MAPGFRLCPSPAKTIIESGTDAGNFRGVAIFVQGQEVVLVSELAAGWYRYISAWRFHADGTIRPVMDQTFPLGEVAEAHRRMEHGDHIGKIVLQVAGG